MKTALQVLDHAVNTVVSHELGEEGAEQEMQRLGITVERKRTVAGLKVVSHAARDAGVDSEARQLQAHLIEYRGHRQILEAKLARVDVQPIAMLPSRAWQRLSRESGLIRMSPVGDSVVINLSGALKASEAASKSSVLRREKRVAFWKFESILILLAAVFIFSALYLPERSQYGLVFVVFIMMFVGSIVTSAFSDPKKSRVDAIRRELAEAWIKDRKADGTLYGELFPGGVEPQHQNDSGNGAAKIRIRLPDPPADVQETIIRAQRSGLVLRTAAVPEAIMFAEDLADKVIAVHTEQEAERIANARLDPIVYVQEGNAVAILAQFGDFPIELELVKQVASSAFLA